MGLLDKLWDDIVAGPAPEKGLGKLRRCNTISSSSSSSASVAHSVGNVKITRSITMLKKSASHEEGGGSSEDSTPTSVGTPSSPNSPMASSCPTFSPLGTWRRTRMKKQRNVPDEWEPVEPRSPTGYDWVIISALDR